MLPFPFKRDTAQNAPETSEVSRPARRLSPWEASPADRDEVDKRLSAMELDEPKRRLIRDAKAICKQRKITQARMAEEIGVPRRTLEEWLQFRRMPKAPGETLIRRWLTQFRGDS